MPQPFLSPDGITVSMNSPILAILAASLLAAPALFAAEPKPKYGPEVTLLSASHDYVRKSPAPDFWALMPYYAAQDNDAMCSVASTAMVVNASRSGRKLGSDDELATQKELLKRVKNESWVKGVTGMLARGVTLDQLGPIVKESLEAYGVAGATVEVVHAEDLSEGMRKRLRAALTANEKSARDFIIANFDQKVFTGDAQVGHIAPVGAYDASARRVLVLDPDRQWYEPYWVSEETFLKGMTTRDSQSGKNRGYVWVKLP